MTARPDLAALRVAAEAATPGPWKATSQTVTAPETDDRLPLDVRLFGGNKDDHRKNARHIAACSPDVILALLSELEALRAREAQPRLSWRLDEKMSALLHTMTGSDDAEEATPVTLFVGESRDDDGALVYGLHAYESEYPEEGVIPLVEYAPPAPASQPDVIDDGQLRTPEQERFWALGWNDCAGAVERTVGRSVVGKVNAALRAALKETK